MRIILAVALACAAAFAQSGLSMRVRGPLEWLPANGKAILAYELEVENQSAAPRPHRYKPLAPANSP